MEKYQNFSLFIILIPTPDFPHFFYMLGGNLGSLLYGDVSVMGLQTWSDTNQAVQPQRNRILSCMYLCSENKDADQIIAQLICAIPFVLAYIQKRFSHDAAHNVNISVLIQRFYNFTRKYLHFHCESLDEPLH